VTVAVTRPAKFIGRPITGKKMLVRAVLVAVTRPVRKYRNIGPPGGDLMWVMKIARPVSGMT
jgi:hypothetical protein